MGIDSNSIKYRDIHDEIFKQKVFILNQYGIDAQYVILGVDCDRAIMMNYYLDKRSFGLADNNDACEYYFGLKSIVDKSVPLKLPVDYIQVVIPNEVIGL